MSRLRGHGPPSPTAPPRTPVRTLAGPGRRRRRAASSSCPHPLGRSPTPTGRGRPRRGRRRPASHPTRPPPRSWTVWAVCWWASSAQVRMRSSSTRIASVVRCGEVGSNHTDRPSDARRVVVSGSRSVSWSTIASVNPSTFAAHSSALMLGWGRARSHTARTTSARPHAEPRVDSSLTTSASRNPDGSVSLRTVAAAVNA